MKRMGKMSSSITYYTILYLFANEINSRSVFWLTFILHTVRISVSNSQKRCIGSNGTISIIIWIIICVSISYTDTEHWTLTTVRSGILRSKASNHLVPFLLLMQLAVRRRQFPIVSNAYSFLDSCHTIRLYLLTWPVYVSGHVVELNRHNIVVTQSINIKNWVNAKSLHGIVVLSPFTICDIRDRLFSTQKTNQQLMMGKIILIGNGAITNTTNHNNASQIAKL